MKYMQAVEMIMNEWWMKYEWTNELFVPFTRSKIASNDVKCLPIIVMIQIQQCVYNS